MSAIRVEPAELPDGSVRPFRLQPTEGIPNSTLPLLVAPQALPAESRNAAAAKRRLENAGWTGTWTYTVFPFWHFHTKGHEVLACIAGEAVIGFGGEGRMELRMRPGDAVVIPAGLAHMRIKGDDAFQVAGAYPPGQEGDIVRPGEMDEAALRRALASVPLPPTDPLTGARPGMLTWWSDAPAG